MTGEEYMEESDYFESEEGTQDLPLKEGVVGSQIVRYFEEFDGRVVLAAVSLGSQGQDQQDYQITFEGGLSQPYRVTFAGGYNTKNAFEVLDATPLN
jgi:hypothetical protein